MFGFIIFFFSVFEEILINVRRDDILKGFFIFYF